MAYRGLRLEPRFGLQGLPLPDSGASPKLRFLRVGFSAGCPLIPWPDRRRCAEGVLHEIPPGGGGGRSGTRFQARVTGRKAPRACHRALAGPGPVLRFRQCAVYVGRVHATRAPASPSASFVRRRESWRGQSRRSDGEASPRGSLNRESPEWSRGTAGEGQPWLEFRLGACCPPSRNR